jgi:hypothetical protein
VALAAAIASRVLHPAVITQIGCLAWLTTLAALALTWISDVVFLRPTSPETGVPINTGPDPVVRVLGAAVWWLALAVVIALIGLREARVADRTRDPAAARRAAVSRFWAGLTAVLGLSTSLTRSEYRDDGDFGRVVDPWINVVALLVLSAILIERAFRREATSFIYAAALGLILALTDLNVSYLSGSTEIALVIEGVILLAVGVGVDRLRRRIGGTSGASPPPSPPEVPLGEVA